jgi:hypothetical protein
MTDPPEVVSTTATAAERMEVATTEKLEVANHEQPEEAPTESLETATTERRPSAKRKAAVDSLLIYSGRSASPPSIPVEAESGMVESVHGSKGFGFIR